MNFFQVLNAVTFAALLFIVASGFTLIFGLLRVVNLAHGAIYLVGGYIGYMAAVASNSFVLGIAAGMAGAGILGLAVESGLFRFVRAHPLRQVLLSLGVAILLDDLALAYWGGNAFIVPTPSSLQGAAHFFGVYYPLYRLFVLVLSIIVFFGLYLLIQRTRLGILIRAGVDDPEMIEATGVNIQRIFRLTFVLGAALAGLGGVIGGVFLSLYPSADSEILVFSLAIVVIGGSGSLVGAALGSILIGFLATFGQVFLPQLAYFVIFGPMALILAVRPTGLFGRTT